jgi:hypothetical protein
MKQLSLNLSESTDPNLKPNRHDRGWSKFQLLTYVTVTEQSWRYCIEPMGQRDTVWERSGYVELIRFERLTACASSQTCDTQ